MLGLGGGGDLPYVILPSIHCYRIEAIVDRLYYSFGGGGGGQPPPPPPGHTPVKPVVSPCKKYRDYIISITILITVLFTTQSLSLL